METCFTLNTVRLADTLTCVSVPTNIRFWFNGWIYNCFVESKYDNHGKAVVWHR